MIHNNIIENLCGLNTIDVSIGDVDVLLREIEANARNIENDFSLANIDSIPQDAIDTVIKYLRIKSLMAGETGRYSDYLTRINNRLTAIQPVSMEILCP